MRRSSSTTSGLRLADGWNDVAADRDLVDDLEVVRVGERAPDRGLHQPVVVRNEYAKSLQSRSPFVDSRAWETQHGPDGGLDASPIRAMGTPG